MNLTLEIVSPNGQGLGPARYKVFGAEGGRIGRAPDCDWVLPSPYISRHHATIRWVSGTYYVESTGENGVAINAAQAMIPQRERRALRNGDRLFIDEYEITVGIAVAAAESPAARGLRSFAPVEDPLADLVATARSPALVDPLEPSHDELDPLKHLSGGVSGRAAPAFTPAEVNWNHTAGVRDQFTPPAVPSGTIPDDWDKTSFGPGNTSGPAQKSFSSGGPTGKAPTSGFSPIPERWDETSFSRPEVPDAAVADAGGAGLRPAGQGAASAQAWSPARGASAQGSLVHGSPAQGAPIAGGLGVRGTPLPLRPAPVGQGASAPQQRPTQRGGAQQSSTQQGPTQQGPTHQSPAHQSTAHQSSVHQRPAQRTPAQQGAAHQTRPTQDLTQQVVPEPDSQQTAGPTTDFDLTAFLRAAGVDPATVPADTAASLGVILKTVVQGVMEVLHARAEIKNEFRLPHTQIRTAENNPLKFSVNAEEALNSLLGRRSPAYLPPVDAFEDAFDDIRFHQMAMLVGMRAGFEHATKRFDPQRLQEVFEKRGTRGGLLQMATKSRYWELYIEEFRQLTGDPDDAFRRLFGDVFASAYEQQLEQLKRSRRKPPR